MGNKRLEFTISSFNTPSNDIFPPTLSFNLDMKSWIEKREKLEFSISSFDTQSNNIPSPFDFFDILKRGIGETLILTPDRNINSQGYTSYDDRMMNPSSTVFFGLFLLVIFSWFPRIWWAGMDRPRMTFYVSKRLWDPMHVQANYRNNAKTKRRGNVDIDAR